MAYLPLILLIATAIFCGATVLSIIIAIQSSREHRNTIFPVVREVEGIKAQRARIGVVVFLVLTSLSIGGWIATQRNPNNVFIARDNTSETNQTTSQTLENNQPQSDQTVQTDVILAQQQVLSSEDAKDVTSTQTEETNSTSSANAAPPTSSEEASQNKIDSPSNTVEDESNTLSETETEPTTPPNIVGTTVVVDSNVVEANTSIIETVIEEEANEETDEVSSNEETPQTTVNEADVNDSEVDATNETSTETSTTSSEQNTQSTATTAPDPTTIPVVNTSSVSDVATDEATIGPIAFALDVNNNREPVNPGSVFDSQADKIYAVFSYEQMQNGVPFAAVWYYQEEEIYRAEYQWSWGSASRSYVYIKPVGPGNYKIELQVGNDVLATDNFEIIP